MRVALIMGSLSDLPKVESIIEILKQYGVKIDVRCLSAHRAHNQLVEFIQETNNNGTEVIIAAAGMAADSFAAGMVVVDIPAADIPVADLLVVALLVADTSAAHYCSSDFHTDYPFISPLQNS